MGDTGTLAGGAATLAGLKVLDAGDRLVRPTGAGLTSPTPPPWAAWATT